MEIPIVLRGWLWPMVSAVCWGKQAAPGRALSLAASELPALANPAAVMDAPLYILKSSTAALSPTAGRRSDRVLTGPARKGFQFNCWLLPASRSIWLYNEGKAGGRCLKVRLTHPRAQENKALPKQSPTGPSSGEGKQF